MVTSHCCGLSPAVLQRNLSPSLDSAHGSRPPGAGRGRRPDGHFGLPPCLDDLFKVVADTAEQVVLFTWFRKADEEKVSEGEGGVPLGEALVIGGQCGAQAVFEQSPVEHGGL